MRHLKRVATLFSLLFLTVKLEASPRVIIIGIDGFNTRSLEKAHAPAMASLRAQGAYSLHARCIFPSMSVPNWATLLTSVEISHHGFSTNDTTRESFLLPPQTTGFEDIFPTIFSILRLQRPNVKIGVFYHWNGFAQLFETSIVNAHAHYPDAAATTQAAIDYFLKEKPDLLFIHLDTLDHTGHTYGHDSKEYLDAVTTVDGYVRKLLDAVAKSGIEEETTIILSSDHGGIGRGHGGLLPEEMAIPFIIKGPRIKHAYEIKDAISIKDIAPTTAYALGLQLPQYWSGRIIKAAFSDLEEPSADLFSETIESPKIFPEEALYDHPVEVHLKRNHAKNQIRYTLDGSLPTLQSPLYEGPLFVEKSTLVRARAFLGQRYSPVATASMRLKEDVPNTGLMGFYYEVGSIEYLPVFSHLDPKYTAPVQEIAVSPLAQRSENFALRFVGKLKISEEGEYTFSLNSDDGSRLFLDGDLLVDNDGSHGVREVSGTKKLGLGFHKIVVEYFQQGGGAYLKALYRGPGIPTQVIPPHVLSYE